MAKIPKNLSDNDMLAVWDKKAETKKSEEAEKVPVKEDIKPSYEAGFLTPELQQSIGKALLEQKVKLYKEGIVDYNIKVKQEGSQIILTAVPRKIKPKA